jgi:DNA polymerase I-like protein with 3'-5' exonuclease and polymerase domains
MISNGLLLNPRRLDDFKRNTEEKARRIEEEIRTDFNLPPEFNLESDDHLRYLLYNELPRSFGTVEENLEGFVKKKEEAVRCSSCSKKSWIEKGGDSLHWRCLCGSTNQLQSSSLGEYRTKARRKTGTKVHKKLLKIKTIKDNTPVFDLPPGFKGRRTKLGARRTANEQGRLSLQVHLQNRISKIRALKRPAEKHRLEALQLEKQIIFLEKFNEYQKISKLLSTYTSFPTQRDKRVHSSLLIHGTNTGRLASAKPNLQNLPKKNKEVRKVFVVPPGFTYLSGDYSNLEVRILAYITEDEPLISAFEKGRNVHDENTRILFNLDSSHPQWDLARRASKIFMFGGISYGGSEREIYQKVILEAPRLNLTFEDFKRARNRWMGAHPGYQKWYREIEETNDEVRTAETFLGRRRTLFSTNPRDRFKQRLNTPIQGGAAGVINDALIRIYNREDFSSLKSKLVLQIHDQLLFEAKLEEVDQLREIVKEEMEKKFVINGREVIFPVDFETGPSLGELEEMK